MRHILTTLKFSIILFIGIVPFTSYADNDDAERIFERWSDSKKPGVSPVKLRLYNEVCGNCHFPYQPGLLPPLSWEMIMSKTDNHFGENLELSTLKRVTAFNYLLDNAAGRVNNEISAKIIQTLGYNPIVIRITDTPYFIKEHGHVDNRDNISVMGQCDKCHQDAMQGKY